MDIQVEGSEICHVPVVLQKRQQTCNMLTGRAGLDVSVELCLKRSRRRADARLITYRLVLLVRRTYRSFKSIKQSPHNARLALGGFEASTT